jgi:Uma2 family endonuclease
MTVITQDRAVSTSVTEEEDAPLPYSPDEFGRLAAHYPDLRMELTAEGEIIIMAPASSETGLKNGELYGQLYVWNKQTGLGYAFDSSSGFTLPNGAEIAPDTSWITKKRWDTLPGDIKKGFAHICPDFVLELRSDSDRLSTLQKKMRQYTASGARLGWLIDPRLKRVEIYRPGRAAEVLVNPPTVSGEDVLSGFVLDLAPVWG